MIHLELLFYLFISLFSARRVASNADVRIFEISMTFRCEWHFDVGGPRCFECVFIHEGVVKARRNGKVVKVITVVTNIMITLHRGEGNNFMREEEG